MIKGQGLIREFFSAVLTAVPVTEQYIRAREANDVLSFSERDVVEEAKHRRQTESDANRSDRETRFLNDFGLPLKQQLNRPLPGHDVERLE